MNKTGQRLSKDLSSISRAYAQSLKKKEPQVFDMWLVDNYHLVFSQANGARRAFSRKGELRGVNCERLFFIMRELFADGDIPSAQALISALTDRALTVAECEALPVVIICVLISVIADAGRHKKRTDDDVKNTERAIKSLRTVQDTDFSVVIRGVSAAERILSLEPTEVYSRCDDSTRAMYRRALARRARQKKISETQAAKQVLSLARESGENIGKILDIYSTDTLNSSALRIFTFVESAFICFSVSVLSGYWFVGLLLFLPVLKAFGVLSDTAARRRNPPHGLAKIDIGSAVPEDGRTVIAVCTLLPKPSALAQTEKHLSQLKRTNGSGAVSICLLADFKSSDCAHMPSDDINLSAAKQMTDRLNKKYGGSFILAVRDRIFSPTGNEYTGYERKRGALLALSAALSGEKDAFYCLYGDVKVLENTKYIMALDSDTDMPLNALLPLVAAAVHPLNKAVTDDKNVVSEGWGIFAPRVVTDIHSASKTGFSRSVAGSGGLNAYSGADSDLTQCMFSDTVFCGKGLIDAAVYLRVLRDRLPAQRVLSHDIIEGEFLRTAFVEQSELTDSFPSNQASFFAREHRWLRGDMQNIIFLRKRLKLSGVKTDNPLSFKSRLRIADNISRAVTPVMSLFSLAVAAFVSRRAEIILCAGVLICTVFPELFAAVSSVLAGGLKMLGRLFRSETAPVALVCLLRAAVDLLMLARRAFNAADAIIRSLFRMSVSEKKLLEWTTAAESEKNTAVWKEIKALIPQGLAGAALIISLRGFCAFFGVAFIVNIFFSVLSSKEKKRKTYVYSASQESFLLRQASAQWMFFNSLVTEKDNFLPVDNIQLSPVNSIAHRTSPTNIGLMLCSFLAARDLCFIDSAELFSLLDNSLATVEKLQKWHGNLYNWYDTRTLDVISPEFISFVDSGNFLCCLTALAEGLREYAVEQPRLSEICERIESLVKETDLTPMYNPHRRLFHIGIDARSGEPSQSYYDLLMSESRMSSYFAVASGAVSKKHWEALGRIFSEEGRYSGPVSWTGTVFEYFMPYIFLPAPENTLTFEGLWFCIYSQRKAAEKHSHPFGISESGYYSFDNALNYAYKAHGVEKLGLKKLMNDECVVSPYSSFLTLPLNPGFSIKNLRSIERAVPTGRFGFFEALDYSSRRPEGSDYAVVRSYMAHHVGMSLLSIDNALNALLWQRRFISNESMAAGMSLLYEKIPSDAVIFKEVDVPRPRVRPSRPQTAVTKVSGVDPFNAVTRLYSSGAMCAAVTETGAMTLMYKGLELIRRTENIIRTPSGIFAGFNTAAGTGYFTPAPVYPDDLQYSTEFRPDRVVFQSESAGVQRSFTLKTVNESIICTFKLRNTTKKTIDGELVVYFEPSLSQYRSESVHRAYSKLFIGNRFDEKHSAAVYSVQRENSENVCLAVGFRAQTPWEYDFSREQVLKRPDSVRSFAGGGRRMARTVSAVDCCFAASVPVSIASHASEEIMLFITVSDSEQSALSSLLGLRYSREKPNLRASCVFKQDSAECMLSERVLRNAFFLNSVSPFASENSGGRELLWQLGISGDEPITLVRLHGSDVSGMAAFIRLNSRLVRNGIINDLVILYSEQEDYERPVYNALRALCDNENSGAGGGRIFLVNTDTTDDACVKAVCAAAKSVFPTRDEPPLAYTPVKIGRVYPDTKGFSENGFYEGGYNISEHPRLPWCFVLANSQFGTLISDRSLGYTWALNSRENKLTPWSNDSMSDNNGELLLVSSGSKKYDLVSFSRAVFRKDRVEYHSKCEGCSFIVTVTVPSKGMRKDITVEVTNNLPTDVKLDLFYIIRPCMGVTEDEARFLSVEKDNDMMFFGNTHNTGYEGFICLRGRGGRVTCSSSNNPFVKGVTGSECPCGCVRVRLLAAASGTLEACFTLSFAASRFAAEKLTELTPVFKPEPEMRISSPDMAMNELFNNFLQYQVSVVRLKARTGFWQCGGAYGFRDQLQDSLALITVMPEIAQRHIFRCCAVQFEQGDVLHWWHVVPEKRGSTVRGVRTRCSDDLLWLPFVTARYVKMTGDTSVLSREIFCLSAPELGKNERDRFFTPERGDKKISVYEHCMRAINRACRFGIHSLPLIGSGDWNDSYNLCGEKMQGESVWLAQFLSIVLREFADVCSLMDDNTHRENYLSLSAELLENVDKYAWDGDRYIRAFYDDGEKLGASDSEECRIDILPQAFASFSGMPDAGRRITALETAYRELVDEKNGIIKLFTPPLTAHGKATGYVNRYPPGTRENGGQYTHAAVWFARALLREGLTEKGLRVLSMLNPLNKDSEKYMAEPYMLAGDVYCAPGFLGRAGWSLYTGAAGWYLSTAAQAFPPEENKAFYPNKMK